MPALLCPYARQQLGEIIGSGAYGIAYRLQVGQREYIVKEQPLYDGVELRVSTIVEAAMLASISHPNIISLYEICIQSGRLQLIEESGGQPLYEWRRHNDDPYDIEFLADQARGVVDFLHANDIYHNDISLNNLLVDEQGHLSVIDFGLAAIGSSGGIDDYVWQEWLGDGGTQFQPIHGTINRAPEIRDVESHASLYQTLRRETRSYVHFYNYARHLIAASRLPDNDLLFTAACYLVIIMIARNSDIEPFTRASGEPAESITATALELAQDLDWRLLP